MKILILNPNASEEVTEKIRREAQRLNTQDLSIDVATSSEAPKTIVTGYDEVMGSYHVLKELQKRQGDYDAAVIACASDPGLFAAREVLNIPVTGIFEAAVHMSNIYGNRFAIIGSCGVEDVAGFVETTKRYGYESRLTSVRYLGVGVNGVGPSCSEMIREKILQLQREEGVNAVILGCAAFAGYGRQMSEECGIYVTDGIEEAIRMAQMMLYLKNRNER